MTAARAALNLEPEVWSTPYMLAWCLRSDPTQLALALSHAEEARGLAPGEAAVHRLCGAILRKLGRRKTAYQSYRQALELDPSDAIARHELARIDYERGALAQAVKGFTGAVSLDHGLQVGAQNLGRVAHRLLVIVATVLGLALALGRDLHPSYLVPAIACAAVTVATVLFIARSGAALKPFIRYLWRVEPGLIVGFGLCLIAMVLIWVRLVLPPPIAVSTNLLIPVLLLTARWALRPNRHLKSRSKV